MKNILATLLIGLIMIISGCVSDSRPEKPNITYIEPLEKNVPYVEIEKVDELKLNARPSFSVGQRFVYKTDSSLTDEGYNFEEWVFDIKQIERIDGREYYVIVHNLTVYISKPDSGIVKNIYTSNYTWYCDKENGKCIGKNINPEKYSDENVLVTDSSFFAYWMLGLKENLRWNMYSNSSMKIDKDKYLIVNTKYEFEVVGKEKVNNIECFKVKMRYIDVDTNKVEFVRIYWIDVERRILIKKIEFEGGTGRKIYELNLINES